MAGPTSLAVRLIMLTFIATTMNAAGTVAAPFSLSYSGRLTDASQKPIAGKITLTVKFYRSAQGGAPVGPVLSFPNTQLVSGIFQISLALDPTDADVVFDGALSTYIEIRDETHRKTYPRQVFSAVPYALKIPIDNDTLGYNAQGELFVSSLPVATNTSPGLIRATNSYIALDGAGDITSLHADTSDTATSFSGALAGDVTGAQGATYVNKIQNVSVQASGASNGDFLKWDSSTSTWKPGGVSGAAGGTVTNLAAGDGLTTGGSDITTTGTIDLKLFASGGLSKSLGAGNDELGIAAGGVSNAMLAAITTAGKVSGSSITSGTIAGSTAIDSTGSLQTSGNIVAKGTGAAVSEVRLNDADNSNHFSLKTPTNLTSDRSWILPDANGASGDILRTDGAGNLSWVTISNATTGAAGYMSAADKTNLNTAYGERAQWDGGSTNLVAATGRTSLGLGTAATLDAGTGANNLVQLDSGSKLPAVDGSALTNLPNQVSSATVDGAGAVMNSDFASNGIMTRTGAGTYSVATDNSSNWNTAYSERAQWDGGSTNLVAATGRTSLGLGTAATLNVGTSTNNVVQLDGNSKLPTVDGSALTALNADNIGSGTLSLARGGTGETSASAAINALVPSQGSNGGKFLTTNGTAVAWANAAPDYILLEDVRSSGTNGGTATASSWTTRTINTTTDPGSNVVSLTSNQFTLKAGTYDCDIEAVTYRTDDGRIRLYNVTSTTALAYGLSQTNNSYNNSVASLKHRFTLASQATLRVDHYVTLSSGTTDFGKALGIASVSEKYLTVRCYKY